MGGLGAAQNEDVNEDGYVYVRNKEKEMDQKKKKKKKKEKLDANDDGKELQKARKKDKRINDDREVRESLKETHMIGKENLNQKMIDNKGMGNNSELGMRREKKKKHKEEKRVVSYMKGVLENNKMKEVVKGQICSEKRENDERKDGKEEDKKEKKKKRKREMEDVNVIVKNNMTDGEVGKERELSDGKILEKAEPVKKKKRKENKNNNNDMGAELPETVTNRPSDKRKGVDDNQSVGKRGNALSSRNEIGERNLHAVSAEDGNKDAKQKKKKKKAKSDKHVSEGNEIGERNLHAVSEEDGNKDVKQKKKKKAKSDKYVSDGNCDKGVAKTKKDLETTYENSTPRGTSKRVSFSDHVEVYGKSDQDDSLVRGKRFSREEDEMVKMAVLNYIEAHGLGDEGLNMVLHCKSHPEIKNCWKEIGAALPWRPSESVYYRAHILFERSEKRKWTHEEYELIRSFHEKHGSDWRMLADALGKHRVHVKDTWRRIKLPNRKKGRWSQEEYQKLFDLVNMDLRMKVSEEKKSKHGMLRDNIAWAAISDNLSTRSNDLCCQKWYTQLTSPMVAEGIWADADDYRLVDALYALDACCIEDVDWDNLLEHRSGDVCRRRWDQMLKHIGEHANKSFAEQVEVISKRYCTDVLEARETYDCKPAVS